MHFCQEPRSRGDLLRFTGMTNSYLMSKYVCPLVESGRLHLSLPTKPKSEKRRFCACPLQPTAAPPWHGVAERSWLAAFATNVAAIESMTGLDFIAALPDDVETNLWLHVITP